MLKINPRFTQAIGIAGALICLAIFIAHPSFPTPDKLLIFLFFIFLSLHQAKELLKHMLPFVLIILTYESFRGLVPKLNTHVNFGFAPRMDIDLFGNLPTVYLQHWWWHGHVHWYDIVLYIPYLLFFLFPFALAILVWKTRAKYYWEAVCAYAIAFYGAFITFLLFPAAPPWMASDRHYITPIHRISSDVWNAVGLQNFPSVYDHIAPNPVAAVPSLHSACSTLFMIIIFRLYGWRWGLLSSIYPILIYIGVVYEGEHYAFDVITGILLALVSYWLAPYLLKITKNIWSKFRESTNNTRSASKSAR